MNNYDFSLLLPDRPIAFNRDFVRLGIGIKGALMLSQAIYWSKRTKDPDGWFYKNQAEWEEETGLTPKEQKNVNDTLKTAGFLIIEKRGLPAKNYYRVDSEAIINALTGGVLNKWVPKGPTGRYQRAPLTITETTTEITLAEPSSAREIADSTSVLSTEFVDSENGAKKDEAKQIVQIIDAFIPIAAKNKMYYKNKGQREACKILLSTYGLDKVLKRVEQVKEHKFSKFFPIVTSPYELLASWEKIVNALYREQKEQEQS